MFCSLSWIFQFIPETIRAILSPALSHEVATAAMAPTPIRSTKFSEKHFRFTHATPNPALKVLGKPNSISSWQWMQLLAPGIAWRRALLISSPQLWQMPNSPRSIRAKAFRSITFRLVQ